MSGRPVRAGASPSRTPPNDGRAAHADAPRFPPRLAGLAASFAVTFALNQARVVALFYAYRHDRAWFDALHGYVGPLLLIAAAGVFFSWWVRRHVPLPRAR